LPEPIFGGILLNWRSFTGGKVTQAVVLIGPPAVGKGTLLRAFSQDGVTTIEMRKLIRAEMERDPVFLDHAEDMLSQGLLLDDSLMEKLVEKAIRNAPAFQELVIDGYPRNRAQAKFLRRYLLTHGFSPQFIVLQLSDEECRKRMTHRALQSEQPRSDDREDVHKRRMRDYREHVREIEAFLAEKNSSVHYIDAIVSPGELYHRVRVATHISTPLVSADVVLET
jgi:adenylate kinase